MNQAQAKRLIADHCIPISRDFSALPPGAVNALNLAADASNYYTPADAECSRAESFFGLLRRTVTATTTTTTGRKDL
jgi:hypothetical protein